MLHIVPKLRDFLDKEQLKWLPGNLKVEQCILLTKHEIDDDNVSRKYVYIFDSQGCLIGKIDNNPKLPETTTT